MIAILLSYTVTSREFVCTNSVSVSANYWKKKIECSQRSNPLWTLDMVQQGNRNPNRSHHQTRAQRKRVAAEKEEQRRECALTFEKSRSKRYKACSDVVPVTGLEPVRCRQRWILSPLRLPIPSHRRGWLTYYIAWRRQIQGEICTFTALTAC